MIIYGTRNKELAKELITDKCPNCGTQNSMEMHVFQKYAHVFWIPFFPMSKSGVSQCDHCKQVLKVKEMPQGLQQSYETLKAQTKTPPWTFAGLALLVGLIALLIVNDKKKDERNANLILSPKVGDIFEIKTVERQYTLYKVDAVEGDSVFVRVNNYETDKISGINALKNKSYSDERYGFSKPAIQEMLRQGEILNIDRK